MATVTDWLLLSSVLKLSVYSAQSVGASLLVTFIAVKIDQILDVSVSGFLPTSSTLCRLMLFLKNQPSTIFSYVNASGMLKNGLFATQQLGITSGSRCTPPHPLCFQVQPALVIRDDWLQFWLFTIFFPMWSADTNLYYSTFRFKIYNLQHIQVKANSHNAKHSFNNTRNYEISSKL